MIVLSAILALAGCVGTSKRLEPQEGSERWPLLSPASLGSDRQISQVLRGAFEGREITLNCIVVATPEKVSVVGLTALGLRAFTIAYDGDHVEAQRAAQVPEFFKAEQLLNDLQLVYWPLSALQTALQRSGWSVSEPAAGTRRLQRNNHLIAEVHYADTDPWNGRVWIVHFDVPYTLGIESRPLAKP